MLFVFVIALLVVCGLYFAYLRVLEVNYPQRLLQKSDADNLCNLAIPFHTDNNGMPVVDIRIGTPPQRIPVAIDTGSSDLVVAGTECRSCRKKFHPLRSKTAMKLDTCSVITYGTQRDEGCWHSDDVEFHGVCVDSCINSARSHTLVPVVHHMTFVVSHERTKSPYSGAHPKSDYSILGLAQTPRHDSNTTAISQILPQSSDSVFTIINNGERDKHFLVLGALTCPDVHFTPLPPIHHDGFFAAAITQIDWGEVHETGISTLVLDSGSNMVFIPSRFWGPAMEDAKKQKRELVFKFPGNHVSFVIPSDAVGKVVMSYESNDPVAILGCLVLRHTALEFNVNTKATRIAPLSV